MAELRVPSRLHGLMLLLAATALFIRALLPVGFMPQITEQGITMVICSGMTSRTVQIDAAGQIIDASDDPAAPAKHDQPCAFAGFVALASGATPALLLLALAYILATATRPSPRPLRGAAARLRPPAQAPPQLLTA